MQRPVNPSLYNIEIQAYCQKLEKKLGILEQEKQVLEKLVQEKEKSFLSIQSQLQSLKRKIHHHKSTWVQIAEDNKLLKNQLQITCPESANEKDFLCFHLEFLIQKIYTGVSSGTQRNYVLSLFNNDKYFSCLQEVVLGCIGYFEELGEKTFSYAHSPKTPSVYSIDNAISPINQKNYSEDDEEIDKLLDESKLLLRTLDKQSGKLYFNKEL